MNKEDTIQQEINNIMDTFDFRKVSEYMAETNWTWASTNGVPEEWEIRSRARELMSLCENTATGGFKVMYEEGVDDGAPWVRINLAFVIESTLNDGVSYDEANL